MKDAREQKEDTVLMETGDSSVFGRGEKEEEIQ